MNTESIGFTTRSVAIRKRDDSLPAWTAQILAKKAVDDEEFCAAVAPFAFTVTVQDFAFAAMFVAVNKSKLFVDTA